MRIISNYTDYLISKDGKVYSKKSMKKLTPNINEGNGYLYVVLYNKDGRKNKYIHRLLAETYIPNPLCKPDVNHIDGNKLNNNLDNLEWSTTKENVDHALNTGLLQTCKPVIDDKGNVYKSASDAARSIGVRPSNVIINIKMGYRTKGILFKYI